MRIFAGQSNRIPKKIGAFWIFKTDSQISRLPRPTNINELFFPLELAKPLPPLVKFGR
jgi:hypothetical protein